MSRNSLSFLTSYFLIIPLDGGSSDVAYDNDAEERYRRCVDGLAKMREEAADDVLLRPELQRRSRSSFGGGGEGT